MTATTLGVGKWLCVHAGGSWREARLLVAQADHAWKREYGVKVHTVHLP